MTPLQLDDMALFVEVVRTASFSKAAARLDVPRATLSRRIAAMERRLGVRLFNRNTRLVVPTEPALRYFHRCAPLIDEARLAHESLKSRVELPTGHVRASMPVDLGIAYLSDALSEFMAGHPGITLDLDLSSRTVDLRAESFDVAFRLANPRGDSLIARKLGLVAQACYAAPAYLDRMGRPRTPADLAQHRCLYVGSAAQGARWWFSVNGQAQTVTVRGPLALNSMSMMRGLAERGMGIAALPTRLAAASLASGALVPVLPRFAMTGWPVFAVTTSRLQPAAVRAFVAFVAAHLAATAA